MSMRSLSPLPASSKRDLLNRRLAGDSSCRPCFRISSSKRGLPPRLAGNHYWAVLRSGMVSRSRWVSGSFFSGRENKSRSLRHLDCFLRRVDPAVVFLDQIDEPVHRLVFRDVELHGFFADVEIDLAGGPAHIAEIGVGHFPGPIDDAAHHGDSNALEVTGRFADLLRGRLEIE